MGERCVQETFEYVAPEFVIVLFRHFKKRLKVVLGLAPFILAVHFDNVFILTAKDFVLWSRIHTNLLSSLLLLSHVDQP